MVLRKKILKKKRNLVCSQGNASDFNTHPSEESLEFSHIEVDIKAFC